MASVLPPLELTSHQPELHPPKCRLQCQHGLLHTRTPPPPPKKKALKRFASGDSRAQEPMLQWGALDADQHRAEAEEDDAHHRDPETLAQGPRGSLVPKSEAPPLPRGPGRPSGRVYAV